jgi:hypothetical protein
MGNALTFLQKKIWLVSQTYIHKTQECDNVWFT